MKRRLAALICALFLLAGLSAQAAGDQWTSTLKVLASNGGVTVAVRHDHGAWWTDGVESWYDSFQQDAMVYSTDGVTWHAADPGPMARTYTDRGGTHTEIDAYRGCWDGQRFYVWDNMGGGSSYVYSGTEESWGAPAYASADGIHWSAWSGPAPDACHPGVAELGPYRFELGQENELWLMDHSGNGLVLPAVKAGSEGMALGDVAAYHTPGGTVTIEVYDNWQNGGDRDAKRVFSYTADSLDWCLEHLAQPKPPEIIERTTDGAVTLCAARVGGSEVEYLTSTDGAHWTRVADQPWSPGRYGSSLLPYNGRTFLILDRESATLYASEDGRTFQSLADTFLHPEEIQSRLTLDYDLCWTGTEYMVCRREAEYRHGPMGALGGAWCSAASSRVQFCDAGFQLTGEYDFGRQVLGVAYAGGVYYAQVSNSEYMIPQQYDYDSAAGSAVYSSTDKTTWTQTALTALPGRQ